MNNLQIFNNPEFGQVRTIVKNNEVWFVGKDVASALGYSNTRDALNKHTDNEDRADVAIHDGRQNRSMTVINESGLYSLALSSKLPTAKQFKRWVTSEVLPLIRISANMVGRLANKFNLKTSEYGDYFYDTAKHSNKEVETFRYYENAINEFRRALIN